MVSLNYKLDIFEGPLDLLLSLIEKNKLDINDIPISSLCEQYMEYISAAQKLDIELSTDFILMAARLMVIKTRMLLPKADNDEDPRSDLINAVLEYKKAKERSKYLIERYPDYAHRLQKDTMELKGDSKEIEKIQVDVLTNTYIKLINEFTVTEISSKKSFEPLLNAVTEVSVTDVIRNLFTKIKDKNMISLNSYLSESYSRVEIATKFISILSLLKDGYIKIKYDENSSGVVYIDNNVLVYASEDFNGEIDEVITSYDE